MSVQHFTCIVLNTMSSDASISVIATAPTGLSTPNLALTTLFKLLKDTKLITFATKMKYSRDK